MIDAWLAGQAEAVVQQTEADGAVFYDSERQRLDADHAQVGGLTLARWGLPETLRHATTFHHAPGKAPESVRSLVFAVHLGDFLAMLAGVGTGADTLLYALDPAYAVGFSLQPEDLERVSLAVDEEYSKVMAAMGGG